jgi:hypothetical protein
MKNRCFPHLLGIGLLIAAAILAAYGQTTGQRSSLAVYVPFDFVAGDKTLLSGRYELTPTSDRVLRVQSGGWYELCVRSDSGGQRPQA